MRQTLGTNAGQLAFNLLLNYELVRVDLGQLDSSIYVPVFAKVQSIRCPSTSCSAVKMILKSA